MIIINSFYDREYFLKMKIKLESSNSQNIPTLKSLQKKILEDIKRIRSGNNAQQNCMHLANYIVELIPHYLFGSEKPKKPSTSTSSSIAASYLYSTFIKKENIPTETTVNYAVNHGDNPLPPSVIPVINEEGATENEIHDLVSDVRRTTVANFITLQNQLVNSLMITQNSIKEMINQYLPSHLMGKTPFIQLINLKKDLCLQLY